MDEQNKPLDQTTGEQSPAPQAIPQNQPYPQPPQSAYPQPYPQPYPQQGTPYRPEPEIQTDSRDKWMPLIAWFVCFWFCETRPFGFGYYGIGTVLLGFGVLALSYYYFRPEGKQLLWFLPQAAIYLTFGLFSTPDWLTLFNMLALTVLFFAMVIDITGVARVKWTRGWFLADMFCYAFTLPFVYLGKLFKAYKNTRIRRILPAIAALLAVFPLLMLVIYLLGRADTAFEGFLNWVGEYVIRHIEDFVYHIIFGLIWSLFLSSMLLSSRKGWKYTQASAPKPYEGSFGQGVLLGALTPFAVVFTLFIGIQASYLFGPAENGVAYSSYARQGFFQLTVVTGIVLALTMLALMLNRNKKAAAARVMCIILIAETGVILVSAVYRMLVYIGAYGLTTLRVLTLIGEAGIAVLLVICCMKAVKPEISFFPWLCGTLLAVLLLANYINIDFICRSYNISRYNQGYLTQWDGVYETPEHPAYFSSWRNYNLESFLTYLQ